MTNVYNNKLNNNFVKLPKNDIDIINTKQVDEFEYDIQKIIFNYT